jgi:hypothetical protein
MKTAASSEYLATELEKVGLDEMAEKARRNEYHDFFSESATPAMDLADDLAEASHGAEGDHREAIKDLRKRHINDGEFDATLEESRLWTESEEGQETFKKLVKK